MCTSCLTAVNALWLAISRSGQLFGWKVEVLWKRFACAKTQNHSKLTQLHRIISTKRLLQQLKSSRRTARVKILVSVRRCACENSGCFYIIIFLQLRAPRAKKNKLYSNALRFTNNAHPQHQYDCTHGRRSPIASVQKAKLG